MGGKERHKIQETQAMPNTIAHRPPINGHLVPRASISTSWPALSSLCTYQDAPRHRISLWPVQASCPDHTSSQLLGQLLTARALGTAKSLTYGKHYWVTAKTSVWYLQYSHTKFKTQHCASYRKEINSMPGETKRVTDQKKGPSHHKMQPYSDLIFPLSKVSSIYWYEI